MTCSSRGHHLESQKIRTPLGQYTTMLRAAAPVLRTAGRRTFSSSVIRREEVVVHNVGTVGPAVPVQKPVGGFR